MLNKVLYVVAVFAVVIFLFLWHTYNSFIRARNQAKNFFADIDVQLKRRASLIDNLVVVVREYAKHEKETFEGVAQARSALENPHGPKQSEDINNTLSQTLKSIFAVSESYPQLRASENFQRLQDQLKETEDAIAQARNMYNNSVLNYNTRVQTFPSLLAAALFGFREEEYFDAGDKDRQSIVLK